jgi:hypothetical protein
MSGGAVISVRVGDVTLVIRAVRVLAVPTGRETNANHYAGRARFGGEVQCLSTSCHGSLQTCEVHVLVFCLQLSRGAEIRVSNSHAEAGLESRYLACSETTDQFCVKLREFVEAWDV